MRAKRILVVLSLMTLALFALSGISMAKSPNAGTTLAGYKTLDICEVTPATDTAAAVWRYSGEIAIWNSGVLDTIGLYIDDWIQTKVSGGQYYNFLQVPATHIIPYPWGEIPAGTTLETATVFTYSVDGPALDPLYIRNSVSMTILNHSNHIGTPYGPNPKATWAGGYPPACVIACGCTYTIGYWGAKPGTEWPVGYDRNALFFLSEYTWGDILPPTTAGDSGSGYYILARQYIGAVLNAANNACVPEGVQNTIDLAYSWLLSNSPSVCVKTGPGSAPCGEQKAWGAILESYNSGSYPGGPEHCGDE
jgi:hypothetical protein